MQQTQPRAGTAGQRKLAASLGADGWDEMNRESTCLVNESRCHAVFTRYPRAARHPARGEGVRVVWPGHRVGDVHDGVGVAGRAPMVAAVVVGDDDT